MGRTHGHERQYFEQPLPSTRFKPVRTRRGTDNTPPALARMYQYIIAHLDSLESLATPTAMAIVAAGIEAGTRAAGPDGRFVHIFGRGAKSFPEEVRWYLGKPVGIDRRLTARTPPHAFIFGVDSAGHMYVSAFFTGWREGDALAMAANLRIRFAVLSGFVYADFVRCLPIVRRDNSKWADPLTDIVADLLVYDARQRRALDRYTHGGRIAPIRPDLLPKSLRP